MNKKILLLIVTSIIIIVSFLFFMLEFNKQPQTTNTVINKPITTPTIIQIRQSQNTIKQLVPYKSGSLNKIEDLRKNQNNLSQNDAAIRDTLIKSIVNPQGILYTTKNIQIVYASGINEFEVEIFTTDINGAKNEAVVWLKQKGLSDDGICKLPLIFYLNIKISNQLKESGIVFNPLPDNCY